MRAKGRGHYNRRQVGSYKRNSFQERSTQSPSSSAYTCDSATAYPQVVEEALGLPDAERHPRRLDNDCIRMQGAHADGDKYRYIRLQNRNPSV